MNCILSSNESNAFKCGTESNGGFQNITVSNCTIYDTRKSGIALEMVDGGLFDRVIISNIVMDNTNKVVKVIKLGIDITAQKMAENKLKKLQGNDDKQQQ